MARTIALLTDFGVEDSYVGVMKGVMSRICPTADFIDIMHAIQPQNVPEAALMLMGAYAYFPPETVFLVVVDPGVGSERRPIAARASGYTFVAPDNGVLTYAIQQDIDIQAVFLSNPAYHLETVSQTFHGRDIFAPVAAHLAAGVPLEALGEPLADLVKLAMPRLVVEKHVITGDVVHIDHFGNVVTSIGALDWVDETALRLMPRFGDMNTIRQIEASTTTIEIGETRIYGIQPTYSTVEPGTVLALVGSSGFLEIAVNQGNGAAILGVTIGDRVEVRV